MFAIPRVFALSHGVTIGKGLALSLNHFILRNRWLAKEAMEEHWSPSQQHRSSLLQQIVRCVDENAVYQTLMRDYE